ncbi:MAG: Phosphatidate cytidylyltransferase, partial [uncultured Rubrobacteraceae bacterium]
APVADRHGPGPGAHRPWRDRNRQGGRARPRSRRRRGRRLRTLPGAQTAPVRGRLRGRRHPDPPLHSPRSDGHTGRRRGRTPLGPALARRQAGDEDAAGRSRRAPDGALGGGAAGAPLALPGGPLRGLLPDHDRGGGALDLGLRRVLCRPLFRTPPRLSDPQPQEDRRGHRRRPAGHGARGRALRGRRAGVHGDEGARDLARRLPREPGRGPLRVRPQAHPGREGPRPLPSRPRRRARPDRQPPLLGARGILHLVARM